MLSDERSVDLGVPQPGKSDAARDRATSAIDLQERERVRIGFDLHDGPAQTMSAALLQVRMLQGTEGAELQRGLDELHSTLSSALREVYDLIESLGGRDADTSDLASRIETCVRGFSDRYSIPADLEVEGECGNASRSLQIATFRIVQEALSNAGRHSEASSVHVRLWLSPTELRCAVSDDGKGFSLNQSDGPRAARASYGLQSMTIRAHLLDGDCVVESAPGEGTRVSVRIPVWQG